MRKFKLRLPWPRYINRKIGKFHLIVSTTPYHVELVREFSIGYGDRWVMFSWGNDNVCGDNRKKSARKS